MLSPKYVFARAAMEKSTFTFHILSRDVVLQVRLLEITMTLLRNIGIIAGTVTRKYEAENRK